MGIWSKRSPEELRRESLQTDSTGSLRRSLDAKSLTAFGIGAIVGAGIFVVTGTAAANYAGPAIVFSFLLAALVCLCPALCYAEMAAMIPVSGGAYSYACIALGELPAWILGWSLVCEFLFAAATISVGWSAYFESVVKMTGLHLPSAIISAPFSFNSSQHLYVSGAIANTPAAVLALVMGGILLCGARNSAKINNAIVAIKLAVLLAFIGFGAFYVSPKNWIPMIPHNAGVFGDYGWSGVFRAAGVIFFAFLGFDSVSTAAREARDPSRDTPLGIIGSLLGCTVLYIAVALVLTGLAPYRELGVADPLIVALRHAGPALSFLRPLVGIGAVIGLTSVMLVLLFALSRVFYAMARDGLLPASLGHADPTTGVPLVGVIIAALATAFLGALFPIELLSELISIGTLFVFVAVCLIVLQLRRMHPSVPRPFRVPCAPIVAGIGIVSCTYLMLSLPPGTWLRFAGWMLAGLAIYYGYGRRKSLIARENRRTGVPLMARSCNRKSESP